MTELSLLSLLPENVGNYHRELRLKIEQQFHLGGPIEFPVPSHITLKYRFPVKNMAELESIIQDFCISQNKTEWTLQGFDYFENSNNYVIFIKAVPSERTREAHARLLNCLRRIPWMQWGPFDHANLQYHVTLASKGITTDNFSGIWSFVNQQTFPKFELGFDNIALLQLDGEKPTIYKIFLLLNNFK